MKYILIPALFIAIVFLTGCPLQTTNSIDGGSFSIPLSLTGKWKEKKATKDKSTTYLIESTDKTGVASAYPFDSTGKIDKDDYYTLIFSTVGNKVFVNTDDRTEEGFYIYRLDIISNTEVKFVPVSENAVDKELEQDKLKAWLLQHKDDNSIYDHTEEVSYIKQ